MKKIIILILGTIFYISVFSQIDTLKSIELKEVDISIRADDKTPITQTTVKKEDVQKNYIGQDMSYILNRTPSINVYSDNGLYNSYTYFRLRGVDQTRINMTLNGIPLNEPEDQGVYFSNYPDFAANINSVQIQRGVGSSTYGSSSYIGSINFESSNLLDSNYVSLETGYGSYNSYRTSIGYNSGVKNKIGIYTRYSHIGSDGYRYNVFNRSKTFFTSIGYYDEKDIVKLTAFSGQSENGMGYLATNIEDIDKDPRTNYLTKEEQDLFNQSLISLQWKSNIDKYSYLNSSVFYNKLDGNYDVLLSDMSKFKLNSDFYGVMTTYNYTKDDTVKFQFGINSSSYNRIHRMSIYPNLTSDLYKNTGYKSEMSAFVKLYYNITKKLIIFTDIQGRKVIFGYIPSKIENIDWEFFNPKGGLRFNQNNKLSFYTSIGINHREPTRNDLFNGYDNINSINTSQYTIGGDTINIKSIKPEKVTDFELGIEYKSKNSEIKLNGYYMKFENEIAQIGQISYIGLPLRKNVKSSFRSGIEFDLVYQIIEGLFFSENLNYSYNKIKEYTTDFDSISYRNVSPLLTPSIISNSSVYYKFKNLTIGINGRYVSISYLDNTQNKNYITPEFFLIDGFIQFDIKNIDIKFSMNNITNQRYFTSGYVSGTTSAYYVGAPQNYYLSLSYKF